MGLFASCRVIVLSSLALAGCVGEPSGPAQGELGGACLPNGTCGAGLSCVMVGSASTCQLADAGSADGASSDAALDGPGADADADADTRLACKNASSNFSCGTGETACITLDGTGTTHCGTACLSGDQHWQCFSPAQCTNTACCLGNAAAALTNVSASACSGGTLDVSSLPAGGTCAASCSAAADVQLCTSNANCTDATCVFVSVTGGTGTALKSLGVCVK